MQKDSFSLPHIRSLIWCCMRTADHDYGGDACESNTPRNVLRPDTRIWSPGAAPATNHPHCRQ